MTKWTALTLNYVSCVDISVIVNTYVGISCGWIRLNHKKNVMINKDKLEHEYIRMVDEEIGIIICN